MNAIQRVAAWARRVLSRRDRPMSCREVGRVLQLYLDERVLDDGTVGGEHVDAIAAHLEMCRRCGLEEETYRHLKAALSAGAVAVPSSTVVAAPLDDAATQRLREFGDALVRGDSAVRERPDGPSPDDSGGEAVE